ncbi:MAG: DUF4089 domain-containing protein [Rhodocyclaceae bacterium]|nr:DUF4089 domain-containing protein [Rhodocyclaceae bacterium]MBX3669990.1 DUF4089 domain-containing protein [Rhodocyclaceae bacterium]
MASAPQSAQDWQIYVAVTAAMHGLELDPARQAEVALQLQRIALMAQPLLDYPLGSHDESAPVFLP